MFVEYKCIYNNIHVWITQMKFPTAKAKKKKIIKTIYHFKNFVETLFMKHDAWGRKHSSY